MSVLELLSEEFDLSPCKNERREGRRKNQKRKMKTRPGRLKRALENYFERLKLLEV